MALAIRYVPVARATANNWCLMKWHRVLGKLLEVATGPLLLVLAGPIDTFGRRTGVLRGVPDVRVAVTLAPRMSTGAGNVRVPEEHRVDPRPGRGILSAAGEVTGVQFPLPPELA